MLMPMRNMSGFVPGCALRCVIERWHSTPQSTAETTLANSATTESPAVPKIRPPCSAMRPSTICRQA
jgi:hypothetical protein